MVDEKTAQFRQKIRTLVAESQTADALNLCKTFLSGKNEGLENEIILLESRKNQLESQTNKGLITQETLWTNLQQINHTILSSLAPAIISFFLEQSQYLKDLIESGERIEELIAYLVEDQSILKKLLAGDSNTLIVSGKHLPFLKDTLFVGKFFPSLGRREWTTFCFCYSGSVFQSDFPAQQTVEDTIRDFRAFEKALKADPGSFQKHIPDLYRPRCIILMGRRPASESEREQWKALTSGHFDIELRSYDWLLEAINKA